MLDEDVVRIYFVNLSSCRKPVAYEVDIHPEGYRKVLKLLPGERN